MPEWIQAAGMLGWGLSALMSPGLFIDQEFFHPLLLIMSQTMWGILVLAIGVTRLVFLVINGVWRPSAHIRAIGCTAGTVLWGGLLVSALSLSWLTPTSSIYAMLLVSDILSLWFSAGDAKLADLSARGKLSPT